MRHKDFTDYDKRVIRQNDIDFKESGSIFFYVKALTVVLITIFTLIVIG